MEAKAGTPESGEKLPPWHFIPRALVMQRDDAPSMALLVLQDKMPRSLPGHGVPGTVKIGLPSKFQK